MKDPDPELAKGKGTEGESKDPENASRINADSGSSHDSLTPAPSRAPLCARDLLR